ncbi:metal-dependent hydrolase [Geomicrobium sp. JCM 19038]|uniref:metal-dependent hydrolase n=1 Tax=Geomicrobium sp. JCM 19038 TaxID=1460635 RepID=UPI00045F25B2|nr:metal-dependent hydrolase [Geomicrobium sp. JCM 19038]GAK06816.1 membrane-bound metal-dependent hydrolase YdjM [Geomicrobium sp. JCM 19038]
MKAGTHLVGAVALTTLYDRFVPVSWGAPPEGIESFVMLGAALIGGLLPDICHPNSTAGKKISSLSVMIRGVFGHRTFTHSLLFLLIVGVLTGLIPGTYGVAIQTGIIIGMISHYVLDMLTSRGIRLFYPIPTMVRFPWHTKTGSFLGEGSVLFVCMLWISYYSLEYVGVIG